jgi:hypothetical protein
MWKKLKVKDNDLTIVRIIYKVTSVYIMYIFILLYCIVLYYNIVYIYVIVIEPSQNGKRYKY